MRPMLKIRHQVLIEFSGAMGPRRNKLQLSQLRRILSDKTPSPKKWGREGSNLTEASRPTETPSSEDFQKIENQPTRKKRPCEIKIARFETDSLIQTLAVSTWKSL